MGSYVNDQSKRETLCDRRAVVINLDESGSESGKCSCRPPKTNPPENNKDDENNKTVINIDFLYLDLDVCTRCLGTEGSLEEAIAEVGRILEIIGAEVRVRKIHVQTEEQALELGFISSPTIRINGRDIQLESRESLCESCGDLCGEDVDCRVWVYQGQEYTVPPQGMIIDAILREVYTGPQGLSAPKPLIKTLPENLRRFFAAKRRREATWDQ